MKGNEKDILVVHSSKREPRYFERQPSPKEKGRKDRCWELQKFGIKVFSIVGFI